MKKQQIDLYVRVSTQEQAKEGYSIGEQLDRLRKYCEAKDWIIYREHTDPGYSGGSTDRPGLKALIKDVQSKRVDKIVVYKLDRLSRSQKDTLWLIEDIFLANNVDFVSMTENFDTGTPFGRAMIGILSVFAQLEREQIKERTSLGRAARAKDGYFHGGGFSPIGYDYIDGNLVVNEYEALQVKKVYDLVFSGMPIHAVGTYMDKHFKKKYGRWSDSVVRSCLRTPVYTGRISYKGETYSGRHEAIIDDETFNRMQGFLSERDLSKFPKHPFKRTSLLGGLIFCGNCGARYFVKQNTSKDPERVPPQRYYTCYSRGKTQKHMIKDPTCKNPSYNVKYLDALVLGEIKKLSVDQSYFDTLTEERPVESNDREILEERIREIEKQITKLVDLYQIGGIPFETIQERVKDLTEEKYNLEAEIDGEAVSAPLLPIEEAKRIVVTFADVIESGDPDVLRDLVHSLIDGIVIYEEEIKIHWKFV